MCSYFLVETEREVTRLKKELKDVIEVCGIKFSLRPCACIVRRSKTVATKGYTVLQ